MPLDDIGRDAEELSRSIQPLIGELPPHIPEAVVDVPRLGEYADMSVQEAQQRIAQLEDEARNLLKDKYGEQYFEGKPKWMINFFDLDKPDRERIVREIEEIRGMPGVLARHQG